MVFIKKKQWCIVIILTLAFLIRLYGLFTIPFTEDEQDHIDLAETVSFIPGETSLPLGSIKTEHPLLSVYITKIGFLFFGKDKAGGRLLFAFLSIAGIFLIYKATKEAIGVKEALLAALLLSFSQYHIGFSRLISDTGLMFFFFPLILYLFYKLIETKNSKILLFLSVTFGIGYLANEIVFLLIPIFLIYAGCFSKSRFLFKTKEFYISILIVIAIISPSLYWNFQHSLANFRSHLEIVSGVGFSLISLTLYLGEFFSLFIKREVLNVVASVEHAFMNWLLGAICLIGVFYAFAEKKTPFVTLLITTFWSVFIFFSMIKIKSGLYLDNHWWAQLSLFPAVILCSKMLIDLTNQHAKFRYVVAFLVLYLLINCIYFVNIQQNNFIPVWAGILAR